jgi:hypothetical protein
LMNTSIRRLPKKLKGTGFDRFSKSVYAYQATSNCNRFRSASGS